MRQGLSVYSPRRECCPRAKASELLTFFKARLTVWVSRLLGSDCTRKPEILVSPNALLRGPILMLTSLLRAALPTKLSLSHCAWGPLPKPLYTLVLQRQHLGSIPGAVSKLLSVISASHRGTAHSPCPSSAWDRPAKRKSLKSFPDAASWGDEARGS